LGNSKTLENLDVHRCNLNDESLQTILKLPALRYLGLNGTKVSAGAVEEARKAYPAMSIGF